MPPLVSSEIGGNYPLSSSDPLPISQGGIEKSFLDQVEEENLPSVLPGADETGNPVGGSTPRGHSKRRQRHARNILLFGLCGLSNECCCTFSILFWTDSIAETNFFTSSMFSSD